MTTDTAATDVLPDRFDVWDLDLNRAYMTPQPVEWVDATTVKATLDAKAVDATRAEDEARWARLQGAFPHATGNLDSLAGDDPGSLGEFYGMGDVGWESNCGRFDWLVPSTTTPAGETISVDPYELQGFFLQIDLTYRVERWNELTGGPYSLPASVTGACVIDDTNAPAIIRVLTAESRVHNHGGHDVSPSITCRDCTPLPALAALTLAAMTYGDRTALITPLQARADDLERQAAERVGTVDVLDLIEEGHETVPLLDGIVPDVAGVGIVAGPTGVLKSFWSLRLALGVATDGRASRAAYVVGEGLSGWGARLEAEAARLGVSPQVLAGRVSIVTEVPDLFARDPAYHRLVARVARERPRVTVIDTLALASGSAIHDNAGHMSQVMTSARHLAEASGGVVILVAHTGKRAERGIRGSSAIGAAADWILQLSLTDDVVTVRSEKMRDSEAGRAFRYRSRQLVRSLVLDRLDDGIASPITPADLDPVGGAGDEADVPTRILDILAAADMTLSTSQIVAALNDDGRDTAALSTVRGHLADLVKSGEVQAHGENRSRVYEWVG